MKSNKKKVPKGVEDGEEDGEVAMMSVKPICSNASPNVQNDKESAPIVKTDKNGLENPAGTNGNKILLEIRGSETDIHTELIAIENCVMEERQRLATVLNCSLEEIVLRTSDGQEVKTLNQLAKFSDIQFSGEQQRKLHVSVREQPNQQQQSTGSVTIHKTFERKPFLGGYRNRRDNTELWHASAQTHAEFDRDAGTLQRNSRDTQTAVTQDLSVQTRLESCTQMNKPGIWIPSTRDVTIAVRGQYTSSAHINQQRLTAVLTLQRNFRLWKQRQQQKAKREYQEAVDQWIEDQQTTLLLANQRRENRLAQRMSRPSRREDFVLVYNSLEQWRQKTADCAHQNNNNSVATNRQILCHQTRVLANLSKCRTAATTRHRQKVTEKLLFNCQEPMLWSLKDGNTIEVDNDVTLWARSLQSHMRDLWQLGDTDQRAKALSNLCNLLDNVPDNDDNDHLRKLCRRHLDLIARGVELKYMDTLYSRIQNLFIKLIKNPEFNPSCDRFNETETSHRLFGGLKRCRCCLKTRPVAAFPIDLQSGAALRCGACVRLKNEAAARRDTSVFAEMLDELRREEQHRSASSLCCFLVQPQDVQYLVQRVWASHSLLSGESRPHQLCLCRWRVNCHWTPWNSALLARSEVDAHYRLSRPERYYSAEVQQKVVSRHLTARKHFHRLPALMQQLQQTALQLGTDRTPGHQADCWDTPVAQNRITTTFVQ